VLVVGKGPAMGSAQNIVDLSSPAHIAKAIVKANQSSELRQAGLNALWRLYYAPGHRLSRAELEREFGPLEDHFGLYARHVAGELGGAIEVDAIPLANSSRNAEGVEIVTLKPAVVSAVKSYAFSRFGP
jgi:hypothetical protein